MLLTPFVFVTLIFSVYCVSVPVPVETLMPYKYWNEDSTYYLCTVANNEALNRCKLTTYSPVHVGVSVHDALVLKGTQALYTPGRGVLPKDSYENFMGKLDCRLMARVMDGCLSGTTSNKLAPRIKKCIKENDPKECEEELTDLDFDDDDVDDDDDDHDDDK